MSIDFDPASMVAGLVAGVAEYEDIGAGALDDLAEDIVSEAQRLAPVETGELQASIGVRGSGHADGPYVDYGTDDEAAIYQEFGTEYVTPQAFMRRAMDHASPHFGEGIR